jgi:hypothetical protein
MQIIEDEQKRCAPCAQAQERAHCLEELESFARGIGTGAFARGRGGNAIEERSDLRRESLVDVCEG